MRERDGARLIASQFGWCVARRAQGSCWALVSFLSREQCAVCLGNYIALIEASKGHTCPGIHLIIR